VRPSQQTFIDPAGSLPHGGELVDRRLDADEAAALASSRLPSLPLTAAEAADLRALATGAYSPLTGFQNAKEHESVTESMRLPDGTRWSIPICLGIRDECWTSPKGYGQGGAATHQTWQPPGQLQ
jgi:sulfate adenylyltransferase